MAKQIRLWFLSSRRSHTALAFVFGCHKYHNVCCHTSKLLHTQILRCPANTSECIFQCLSGRKVIKYTHFATKRSISKSCLELFSFRAILRLFVRPFGTLKRQHQLQLQLDSNSNYNYDSSHLISSPGGISHQRRIVSFYECIIKLATHERGVCGCGCCVKIFFLFLTYIVEVFLLYFSSSWATRRRLLLLHHLFLLIYSVSAYFCKPRQRAMQLNCALRTTKSNDWSRQAANGREAVANSAANCCRFPAKSSLF